MTPGSGTNHAGHLRSWCCPSLMSKSDVSFKFTSNIMTHRSRCPSHDSGFLLACCLASNGQYVSFAMALMAVSPVYNRSYHSVRGWTQIEFKSSCPLARKGLRYLPLYRFFSASSPRLLVRLVLTLNVGLLSPSVRRTVFPQRIAMSKRHYRAATPFVPIHFLPASNSQTLR